MNIMRTSKATGVTRTRDLPVTQEQLDYYAAGAKVQEAFPNLSADDREFIVSGVTSEEWDALFAQDRE